MRFQQVKWKYCTLDFHENFNNQLISTINWGFPYDFESDNEKVRALMLANHINKSGGRVGKIWLDIETGSVNIVIGLFLAKEEDLKLFFLSCLKIMKSMFKFFDANF